MGILDKIGRNPKVGDLKRENFNFTLSVNGHKSVKLRSSHDFVQWLMLLRHS